MDSISQINFNFYVPMYGVGAFVIQKVNNHTKFSFIEIHESTSDIIEDDFFCKRTHF